MPNPTFIATPTNSDKNLSGWNSRYIYLYSGQGRITVTSSNEVFKDIGDDYAKGSVSLNEDYFNCDDGNSFKITMCFLTPFNGSTLRFGTGLRFENATEATLETKQGALHTLPSKTSYSGLCKYEVILTKVKDDDGFTYLFINGNIIYSRSGEQTGAFDAEVSFIPQHGKISVTPNLSSELIINVTGTASIDIHSITIEEIK
jgi:hypothetical protein